MRRTNAFIEGMCSAFNVIPKQTKHKPNFISEAKTPKVNTRVSTIDSASAWVTVGSYMKKAGNTYKLEHHIAK